ncbi:Septal ring factor [Piscirickettsia salmonis]|uniref:Peptidase M23 family protein n=2 Tax=Piscirickettsia salmonis TaxID=1238 RepID=A0AAC8VKW8_PISSA|nr:peptidase M23 family protein [Piscirickettsia salmonis]QGN97109.1 Septal ring factor [Piscirickettsia salmonis]QGO00703.1 Septal ring factor [Piscirickettsia salmonis]QGO11430.1 Septal ring factor [Piscirickettsia salmonis]QGO18450.1 Septal ring factor [Piscirickettsia salmonis]
MQRSILIFFLIICVFLFFVSFMKVINAADGRLVKVRKKIAVLDQSLSLDKLKRADIEKRIFLIESNIKQANVLIINNQNNINDKKLKLINLKEKQQQLKKNLFKQRQEINRYIKTIFLMGREPYLKLIFSQQDPKLFGRMQHYFQYIMKANLARLEQAEQTEQALNETKATLLVEKKQLERLIKQQEIDLKKLSHDKQLKDQLVTIISTSIDEKSKRLVDLYKNEKRLLALIEQLDQESLKFVQSQVKSFSLMKKQLLCPFNYINYDQAIKNLVMLRKNKPVFIPIKKGSQVQAAYYGQIVFANQLKGYGQLVIIDHAEGYMSLYGYNQKLLVSKGQWISAGDLIALSGQGSEGIGMYFELRHNNQVVSLKDWCQKINLA